MNAETGALRVIPGSHRLVENGSWNARKTGQARELWNAVPSVVLASQPGDAVAFNHNIMHASFSSSSRRRRFTLNLSSHAESPEEIEDLTNFIDVHARFWQASDKSGSKIKRLFLLPTLHPS